MFCVADVNQPPFIDGFERTGREECRNIWLAVSMDKVPDPKSDGGTGSVAARKITSV